MSPKAKEYTERINVFFKPEQLERIKIEADKIGISVSAYIRIVVLNVVKWELVRCKDCVFRDDRDGMCEHVQQVRDPDWYCADGEMR